MGRRVRFALLSTAGLLALSSAVEARAATPAAPSERQVEALIVTGAKQAGELRTIAGALSVVSGQQLEKIGAVDFADYLKVVPGVVFNESVPGWSFVTIRGVASTTQADQGQGTTGYYFDDVPLTDPTYSIGTPDIDAFDANNIAVLRGPQATLFGAAALGGAINYMPNLPDLERAAYHVQGTVADTRRGAPSWSGKAMANLPLVADTLALRAVYYHRDDGGYYQNLGTGSRHANRSLTNGGRLELQWRPSEHTHVNYTFLYQDQSTADVGYAEPSLGQAFAKSTPFPESFKATTEVNALRLDQETGIGILTALASYHKKTQHLVYDATPYFAGLAQGVPYYVNTQIAQSKGATAEVRLASPTGGVAVPWGGSVDYIVGGFYADNSDPLAEPFTGPNVTQGVDQQWGGIFGNPQVGEQFAPNDLIFEGQSRFHTDEYALFGEVNWHVTPAWKLTLGGRYYSDKVSETSVTSGFVNFLLHGEAATSIPGSHLWSGFLPKAAVTWTPNDRVTAYALVSKGFRMGGVNLVLPALGGPPVPPSYGPDNLVNYEAGVRYRTLDGALQLEGDVFHIDWSHVQLRSYAPGVGFYEGNAGRATNDGFEGSATWRPTEAFSLGGSLTYLDARLSEPYDPGRSQAVVPSGATLPGASKWQVDAFASYAWAQAPFTPTLRLMNHYISKAPGIFDQAGVEQGGWDRLDARLTLHLDQSLPGGEISAFVDNITNSKGVLTAQNPAPLPLQQFLLRPITFGVTFDYQH